MEIFGQTPAFSILPQSFSAKPPLFAFHPSFFLLSAAEPHLLYSIRKVLCSSRLHSIVAHILFTLHAFIHPLTAMPSTALRIHKDCSAEGSKGHGKMIYRTTTSIISVINISSSSSSIISVLAAPTA